LLAGGCAGRAGCFGPASRLGEGHFDDVLKMFHQGFMIEEAGQVHRQRVPAGEASDQEDSAY
jgi:hypothetical protein